MVGGEGKQEDTRHLRFPELQMMNLRKRMVWLPANRFLNKKMVKPKRCEIYLTFAQLAICMRYIWEPFAAK